jgi:predicted Zn-dependent protease
MELQRSIRKIAEPLFQTSNKDYEWDIFVVQDNEKEITACTYGAGLIVFNKTFLKLCENETQLASVIAHEIGHNHYNHQVTKRELMKVYNAFEIKKLNKDLHYLNKSFSRQREREADSFVIKAFLETDYNIKEASVMFRMFEKMFGTSADMNTCLYSTHPQHKDRINHLDAVASTYSQLKYKTKDSEAFEYIKNWSRT